jgi:hypothetical protein
MNGHGNSLLNVVVADSLRNRNFPETGWETSRRHGVVVRYPVQCKPGGYNWIYYNRAADMF